MIFALCLSLLALCAELPPLSEAQAIALATAIDDRDHQESAFAGLVEAASAIDSTALDLEAIPDESAFDWSVALADPDQMRGRVVHLHGRLEQSFQLPRPWDGWVEWFVRTPAGRVVALYVPSADDVTPGQRIHVAGWFYKRIEAEARDGTVRRYPAVVGRVVPDAGLTFGAWVPVVCVIVLLGAWFFARALVRGRRLSKVPRRRESVASHRAPESATSEDLPTDPVEALDVLAQRGEDRQRGDHS